MKAYTDLEQSKKLAEFLPLESADMEYILEQWIDEKTHCHKEGYCEIPVVKVDDDCPLQPITYPCWSLAALLDILPSGKALVHIKGRSFGYKCICKDIDTVFYNNSVDACYEMIMRLHELKML